MISMEADLIDSHWDATAHWWRPGVAVLTWHLVFDDQTALHEAAGRLESLLSTGWLDRVPIPWLHLTLQGVAPDPEIDSAARETLVAAAAARCAGLPPIELRLGPARLGRHGVALHADHAAGLLEVRDRLQDADAAVRGRDRVPDWRAPIDPHVTLAYANARADAADLRQSLAARAPETTVELTVEGVSLLRLQRAHRLYHWDVVGEVPFTRPEPYPPG